MMNFISIDPGKVSGVCTFSPPKSTISTASYTKDDLYRLIHQIQDQEKAITFFVETYQVDASTHKKTRQYDAMDIVGAVDYVCWELRRSGWDLLVRQSRAIKSNFPDEWFMEFFDTPSPVFLACETDHEQDALRHMTYGIAAYGEQELWESYCKLLHRG
jgi:hypothetical protein